MGVGNLNPCVLNGYDIFGIRATYNSISQKIPVENKYRKKVDHSFNVKEIHSIYRSGNEENDSRKYFMNKQKCSEVKYCFSSKDLGRLIDILI